jgi:hypothetical protein
LNYEHPLPRVWGYSRVSDIMGVDITGFRVQVGGLTYLPFWENVTTYTLNSVLSPLTTKVHMMLRNFVVLTWMRDAIELV